MDIKKLSIVLSILIIGCKIDQDNLNKQKPIRFFVASDIHYFDPSLFSLPANGYLNGYLENDRKLLPESSAIFHRLLSTVLTEKPDFILISGDLTKDGEKVDHLIVASLFKTLSDKGIRVFVVPGNHDINNANSFSYLESARTRVGNISASEFADIYQECGYREALGRDPNSLSYVSEPAEGIWVLAIDACHYSTVVETAGSIKPETLDWIKSVLAKSQKEDKQVIAMMHHGMMEHFTGQTNFFPGYIISDWQDISATLADLGLKVVFTGHSHAQDIVRKNSSNGFIYDIETGSTVTFPCPFRKVTLDTGDRTMKVESGKITDVTCSTIPPGTDFQAYAQFFLTNALTNYMVSLLTHAPYHIPAETIKLFGIDRILTNGFLAYIMGDEKPQETDNADIQIINNLNPQMGETLRNVWTDPAPADNNVMIDLTNGTVINK